jgi:two-component system, cell cycle sensor histidine kinase and response regulator CckA
MTTSLDFAAASSGDPAVLKLRALPQGDVLFGTLFRSASIGVKVVDMQTGLILDANPKFEQLLGYTLEELCGRPYAELTYVEDRDRERALQQSVTDGETDTFQLVKRYLRKDGTLIWGRVTASVVRDDDGKAHYGVSMVEDVTRERVAEEAQRAAEERYRLIVETTSEGIWVTDGDSRTTFVNKAMASMLGCTTSEVEGRSLFEFVDDEGARQAAVRVAERRTEVSERVAVQYKRADGTMVDAMLCANALFGKDGEYVGMMAIVSDMTEVRRTASLFRMIADNAQDIIYRLRVGENPGYDYISPVVTSILGVTPEDCYADPDITLKYLHEDDVEDIAKSRVSDEQSAPLVVRWRHPDGHLVWLERRTTHSFDEHGNPTAIEGIIRDVSEKVAQDEQRQSLEEQLRQSQKLEAIGRLAGGIAHDFNNLLLALRGYGELALRRLEGGDSGVGDDIAEMLDATDRAAALTNQLLAFGRRQLLNPEVIDLCEVVEDMDKLLRRLIGEQVELVSVHGDKPVLVEVDRSQLEQVIANLAVNGRDAMPEGGRLEIEVGTDGADQAVLSVADNGCGMEEDTVERLFEPYFTTKGDNGTGLGLATVHGIVSQSGGRIAVESAPGKGSTFQVFLPLADGVPAPAAAVVPAEEARGGTESILLIEDDPMVRSIVTAMLDHLGYNVVAVDGSELAIATFSGTSEPFDLVLSDLVMPGLNGRQTFERLRALGCTAKVLYMSGYADDALLGSEDDAPIALIQKPFDGEALARKVRDALDKGAPA